MKKTSGNRSHRELENLESVAANGLLDRRIFMILGAIGVMLYLDYEAWMNFHDSAVFPFALAVYGLVARSRYRIFGKVDACGLPTPEERRLLLP